MGEGDFVFSEERVSLPIVAILKAVVVPCFGDGHEQEKEGEAVESTLLLNSITSIHVLVFYILLYIFLKT